MSCTSTIPPVFNLGDYAACDTIEVLTATQSGNHVFEFHFNGTIQKLTVSGTSGNPFSLDLSNLNEYAAHLFQIKMPDNTYFTHTASSIDYQYFTLKTKIES